MGFWASRQGAWHIIGLTNRSSQRLFCVMHSMSILASVISQLPLAPVGAVAELVLVRPRVSRLSKHDHDQEREQIHHSY